MVTHKNNSCIDLSLVYIVYTDTQCCYLYGSIPQNNSNCFPEGTPISLQYIIYNPHDNFTNLLVRWYRNGNLTRASTSTNEIVASQGDYELHQNSAIEEARLNSENCSDGPLYRDTFFLHIYNFTSHNNGYYWCQIIVNDSVLQPSQYAWFYADDSNSCAQTLSHFKNAPEPDRYYAEYHINEQTVYPISLTNSAAITSHHKSPTKSISLTTPPTSSTPLTIAVTEMLMTSYKGVLTTTTAMELTEPNMEPISYAVGVLSILLLSLGIFAILLLLMLIRKRQIGQKKRKGELTALCMHAKYIINVMLSQEIQDLKEKLP